MISVWMLEPKRFGLSWPKTSVQRSDPKKTKWATWVVGRIGGWKGYDSQGPPGVICLKKGLDRLEHLIQGVRLAKDMCTG